MDKKNQTSTQRVRNILTLEERVRAIDAYDINPVYTKVSKLFNCSWEQIKNIIANRETILKFYEATKRTECNIDASKSEIRQNKISFLGECMYEYIQRAQYHTKVDVTEELIRIKAFEFLDIIQIENFVPNRTWMNHFKATYGFCLSNRQIKITRKPPTSLDVKDIMTYCTKNNAKTETSTALANINNGRNLYRTATKIAVSSANDATLQEVEQRQEQKLKLLDRAFFEYVERSRLQRKLYVSAGQVLKGAVKLIEILQIDHLEPNLVWLKEFMERAKSFVKKKSNINRATASLDLNDIISDCLEEEEFNLTSDIRQNQSINTEELPTCSNGRVATKRMSTMTSETSENKIRILTPEALEAAAVNHIHLEKCRPIIKEEIIDSENESEDIKPNVDELNQSKEIHNEEINNNFQESIIKIQKSECDEPETEGLNPDLKDSTTEDPETLPKSINNCDDALKLIKPLQEFALLQGNNRTIELLAELEAIFENQKQNPE